MFMNKLFNFNYYKYGFFNYWYGYNKRWIGVKASIPFFLLITVLYSSQIGGTLLGIFLIAITDVIFIPLGLTYLLVREFSILQFDFIDKWMIQNLFFILIFVLINRFILNYVSEKYFQINLKNRQTFHNSPDT